MISSKLFKFRNENFIRTIVAKSTDYNRNKPAKKQVWNVAMKEAEKVAGYSILFLNLRWLRNDEIANVAFRLRKLIGTRHPLLKTAQDLLIKHNALSWGLIVLLMSKVGVHKKEINGIDATTGILLSQRVLAEVTEMIRTSITIHKSQLIVDQNSVDAAYMNYGNKIALLCGDFLISQIMHKLTGIKNQEVHELILSALRDFTECEFLGEKDDQNEPLPAAPDFTLNSLEFLNDHHIDCRPYKIDDILGNPKREWVLRSLLGGANLLAKSCQAAMILSDAGEKLQKSAHFFGKHLGLAWRAKLDRKNFLAGDAISLVDAPIMFHLSKDPDLYEYIAKGKHDVRNCDVAEIRRIVLNGTGIYETEKLQQEFVSRALSNLAAFEDGDAKEALENIIRAL